MIRNLIIKMLPINKSNTVGATRKNPLIRAFSIPIK